ncbi:hypothetical protein BH09ACT13_BH09ACT13_01990 [soil metagenome]
MTGAFVPPVEGSELALSTLSVDAGRRLACGDDKVDSLLYVVSGAGALELHGSHSLAPDTAALVLAGEEGVLEAGDSRLEVVRATVGASADLHAPLGPRETVVRRDEAGSAAATGARSFRILFGPHNGSTRATLFLGFIPPGKAPWHYHLYDEIVWVPEGPGKLHLGEGVEELSAASAFRLRPRQVHIVENADPARDMTLLGIFTPAGSPAAAYLSPEVGPSYRFSPR